MYAGEMLVSWCINPTRQGQEHATTLASLKDICEWFVYFYLKRALIQWLGALTCHAS